MLTKKLLLSPLLALTLTVNACGTNNFIKELQANHYVLLGLDGLDYETFTTKIVPKLSTSAQENIAKQSFKFTTDIVDSGQGWRSILYGQPGGVMNSEGKPTKEGQDIFSIIKEKNSDYKVAAYYNWFMMNPNSFEMTGKNWGVMSKNLIDILDDQFDADTELKNNKGNNLSVFADRTSSINEGKITTTQEAQQYINTLLDDASKQGASKAYSAVEQNYNFVFHYDTLWDDIHHGEFSYQSEADIDNLVLDAVIDEYAKWVDHYLSLDPTKWFVGITTDHSRDEKDFNHTTDNAKNSWFISNRNIKDYFNYDKLTSFKELVQRTLV